MNIKELNNALKSRDASGRLRLAVEQFGDDLILTTSFGPTSGVLLELAIEALPDIRVITVRHGYETERTLELAEEYRRRFSLNLRIYDAPKLPLPQSEGHELEHFRRRVKVDTLQRAFHQESPKAWLSGVMRDETPERSKFDFARWRGELAGIYPLLDWTENQAIDYCIAHGLPMNEDYFDPCKGEEQKRECGIHVQEFASPNGLR